MPPKKKKKNNSDDEAFEESDDGDEEGREMDYIESSDSDDSDPELQVNNLFRSKSLKHFKLQNKIFIKG